MQEERVTKKGPIFGLVLLFDCCCGRMSSEVTEDSIVAALEELRKNDTSSVQFAGNYLLDVMNNPANLIILFSILDKGYPDFV